MTSSLTPLACPDRTHLRASSSVRTNRFSALFVVGLGLGSTCLIAPYVSAAPPPVTVSEPVKVEVVNPVEVLGAVDILSEPKKVRYLQRKTVSIEPGPVSNFVNFSIPEGKMLVVETVSVEGYLGSLVGFTYGSLELLATSPDAPAGTLSLPMSAQGGGTFMATLPVLLRVDSSQNVLTARFYRSASSADSGAFYSITVFGYLEDL